VRTLIVDPLHNSPGEHDDSGAFEIAARALAQILGPNAIRFSFDNAEPYAARLAELERYVTGLSVDAFVEISHSTHHRMQSGIDPANVATLLRRFASPPKVAVLLACSAASPPLSTSVAMGFYRAGLDVYAHTTVGHAYLNPFVTQLRENYGEAFVVEPHSTHWRAWIAFLKRRGWARLVLAALGDMGDGFFWQKGFLRWEPPSP
jgi:hypothetical protein